MSTTWAPGSWAGKYGRDVALSTDGCWKVCETYQRESRPFYVMNSAPGRGHFTSAPRSWGFGYYATAEAAQRAVDRYLHGL
jgi:hypothetical protein